MPDIDPGLARSLILDELFDLRLYERLRGVSRGETRAVLDRLIPVEAKHFNFWQGFFKRSLSRLDAPRRIKLEAAVLVCRVFGPGAVHLILEAIEIHGVQKYLAAWEAYKDGPLGPAVRDVLEDEFRHEDDLVSALAARKISPERIRSLFLGFNDGLVEILGAVSGFFAAFDQRAMILMAGATVSVAGAISMAAGAYLASSSEREIDRIERGKASFLNKAVAPAAEEHPVRLGLLVGASYFLGALIPLLPVALGFKGLSFSLLAAGTMIILVSALLSFLSGMEIRRRILTNLVVMAAAVGVSYAIGGLVKSAWGVRI